MAESEAGREATEGRGTLLVLRKNAKWAAGEIESLGAGARAALGARVLGPSGSQTQCLCLKLL